MIEAHYGAWPSPLSATDVATGALGMEVVAVDGHDLYWLESRPSESGRVVLVRGGVDRAPSDVTPPGTNVRTRAHEYGGGACLVSAGTVYYSEFADQRIYTIRPGHAPVARTPSGSWRFADPAMHPSETWLAYVREDHSVGGEPITTIVRIDANGPPDAGVVLVSGADFYSTPRFSPDGGRMCWLQWSHPQMPWDGTELWIADVEADASLHRARLIAGGPDESIFQPGWAPDGALCFVSDRTGWWNLYRLSAAVLSTSRHGVEQDIEALCPRSAEFGRPQWVFGMATWACMDANTLVTAYRDTTGWHIGALDVHQRVLRTLTLDVEPGNVVLATPTHAVFVGISPRAPAAVMRVFLQSGDVETVRVASARIIDDVQVSEARAVEFPTDGGVTAHAYFYAPRHPHVHAPDDELPPAIVVSHGGPTSAAATGLNLEIQFWTTRGFAVIDVDYGGSSGYGRSYRRRLNGQWGVVDIADCVNAVAYFVHERLVDPSRLIIRGRSAGGYTTLAALTFRPRVFGAGASYYGVSDLEGLARDTHKFESRYLDTLVGPYPAAHDIYRQRSPIHFVDRIACPIILLQGADDRIVPPNQAEMMADAVRQKGLPVALLLLAGEQHGFRRGESIVRSLESELAFYGAVFGFAPAGPLPGISIDNLERWNASRAVHPARTP
jgi:dipeptidyl aminopeptidase/acylaminoacyl peptidase